MGHTLCLCLSMKLGIFPPVSVSPCEYLSSLPCVRTRPFRDPLSPMDAFTVYPPSHHLSVCVSTRSSSGSHRVCVCIRIHTCAHLLSPTYRPPSLPLPSCHLSVPASHQLTPGGPRVDRSLYLTINAFQKSRFLRDPKEEGRAWPAAPLLPSCETTDTSPHSPPAHALTGRPLSRRGRTRTAQRGRPCPASPSTSWASVSGEDRGGGVEMPVGSRPRLGWPSGRTVPAGPAALLLISV